MAISAVTTISILIYRAIDAAGNIEFVLQKVGVSESVARFLGSDRVIDFFIAISLIALVVSLLYYAGRIGQPSADLVKASPEFIAVQEKYESAIAGLGGKKEQFRQAQKSLDEVIVRVIDGEIVGRSDDYVQFSLLVMNCSALPIMSLEGPSGFIQFQTRNLQGRLTRTGQFRNVARGDHRPIEVRQDLTPGDIAFIAQREKLSGKGYWFSFDSLKLLASNTNSVSANAEFTFVGITLDNKLVREGD